MREPEFDSLDDLLTELEPPERMMNNVNPWETAASRIFIGLGLCTIHLNFLWLNYLLPTIGAVMMFLGFRTLRRQNTGFRVCYGTSILYLLMQLFTLILNATVWQNRVYSHPVMGYVSGFFAALNFVAILALWSGLRSVQKEAGLTPHANGAIGLLFWYALFVVLALAKYNGLIIGILLLIAYIAMLRELHRLFLELGNVGYVIRPAPVKISDDHIKLGVVSILLGGMLLAALCCHSFPMEWTAAEKNTDAKAEEIRVNLRELGFPENVLNDLTVEDLLACEHADLVVTDFTDEAMNDGRAVETLEPGGTTSIHTEYDVRELRLTGVGVRLAGEPEQWRIFHHFAWLVTPKFYGTENLQIWPAYLRNEGWMPAGRITGQVLYERDGADLRSAYFNLEDTRYNSTDFFGNSCQNVAIFAEFSLPRGGDHYRGYVAYGVEDISGEVKNIIDSWVNYTHQEEWMQYPIRTAREIRTNYTFDRYGFRTVQDALQFSPWEEPIVTFKNQNAQP